MRTIDLVVFLFLFVALGFSFYALWMNLPQESKVYESFLAPAPEYEVNASNKIVQFYPNMRYSDRVISYRLESVCSERKWVDIEEAFSILGSRTTLSFYHSADKPEIKVMCSEVSPEADEKDHFIAGEGGPSEIVNATNYVVILAGKISLYRNEKCDEPKVAIHEILHALGFEHYNNSNSILYPLTGCDQEIDREIVDMIDALYAADSLPDLRIESIVANRTGRYLNFNVNVSNVGLAPSEPASLDIYHQNDRIGNFSIGELEIGMKRMLYVQNMRVPSGADSIVFIAELDGEELSLSNNRVEIKAI